MTVAELIAKLSEMPQDVAVVIEDADTQWLLRLKYVKLGTKTYSSKQIPGNPVVLAGDYSDEYPET